MNTKLKIVKLILRASDRFPLRFLRVMAHNFLWKNCGHESGIVQGGLVECLSCGIKYGTVKVTGKMNGEFVDWGY